MNDKEKALEFLTRYQMSPADVDMDAICHTFAEHMAAGLAGKPSSLLMLPTYLTADGEIPENSRAIAMDAGGTNLRIARVSFCGGKAKVEEVITNPMPGSRGEISKEEFLQTLCEYLRPFSDWSDRIGFCFSYPAEITPEKDGRLLGFNKEVQVRHSAGMLICAELNDALERCGLPRKKIVLLNDTVAALLGDRSPSESRDGILGFIWGTGINTCYLEKAERIFKLDSCPTPDMIINCEAGGFDGLSMGMFDRKLDAKSTSPGDHLYEKMVSGAYLGSLIYEAACQAAEDGLLSPEFKARLSYVSDFTLTEVDVFLRDPTGAGLLSTLCTNANDSHLLYCIAEACMERAAKLVCAQLSGCLVQANLGRSKDTPAYIVAEGSTLYRSLLLREMLERNISVYTNAVLGRWCRFVSVENTNLIGSAAAAILNCIE